MFLVHDHTLFFSAQQVSLKYHRSSPNSLSQILSRWNLPVKAWRELACMISTMMSQMAVVTSLVMTLVNYIPVNSFHDGHKTSLWRRDEITAQLDQDVMATLARRSAYPTTIPLRLFLGLYILNIAKYINKHQLLREWWPSLRPPCYLCLLEQLPLKNHTISTNKRIIGFNAKQSAAKCNHSCLMLLWQLVPDL